MNDLTEAPPLSVYQWCELNAYRRLAGPLQCNLEQQLSALGDRADRDLVQLQHDLAVLRRQPFGGPPLPARD